ncbi:MAG: hypothetical protein ACI8P9_002790 [Parasphingorhabdus sp.]|jgi:hypothetical protein
MIIYPLAREEICLTADVKHRPMFFFNWLFVTDQRDVANAAFSESGSGTSIFAMVSHLKLFKALWCKLKDSHNP